MAQQQPNQAPAQQINDIPPDVLQECLRSLDKINKDLLRMIDGFKAVESARSIAILAELGIPLPPNPRNGRDYPENMPEEHQKLEFFPDIQALPDDHLTAWLDFYGKEYTANMDRSQREVKLYIALGEMEDKYKLPTILGPGGVVQLEEGSEGNHAVGNDQGV
ncbi:hypothetical protein I302_108886 [Kwoniella bestiolae CBS 10118]|uniref:Uncharacterized protein n=1 Tax=Kwoniella bestiolae CBS 10118 TaxID=1296100 RepID=A0A1B9FUE2_9TREE|nr:hypothetical protein I302_08023 [Kwoniella bestiolae CBS 10118]OCF22376.1 hypothetical protein I302_08023 [Kwoniella bestiolae CBS 10118]